MTAPFDPDRDPLTRLGPDSGGRDRGGPSSGGPAGHVYTWEWGAWGRQPERRSGLPWIGIFLLVFGGLLLIQQLYPEARGAGSALVLAVGLAFLIKWALDRGTGSLYAGAIITALAAPGVVEGLLGRSVDGLGTFCLGLAFLGIALVRLASGGGWGWQAIFGGLLALIGGIGLVTPQVGGLIVPIALLAVGAALVFGGIRRP